MKISFELDAEFREDQGKGASRRLRHLGKVPAILYGGKRDARALLVDHTKVAKLMDNERFYSTILALKVGSQQQAAVLKDVQRHPFKNHIVHIDFQRVLEDAGAEVLAAEGGETALQLLDSAPPGVLVCDLGMPGMDGYEVARRLRQQPGTEKTVLAALTGWGQQEDRRRTAEAGFDHHLVKPPEPKTVESLLASLPRRTQPS